jgi:hypothetical protein
MKSQKTVLKFYLLLSFGTISCLDCNLPCIYSSNQLQFLGKESIYSQLLSCGCNYSETQLQFM